MKSVYAAALLAFTCITVQGQMKKLSVIGSSTSACYGFGGPPGANDNFTKCYINKLVDFYGAQLLTVQLTNDALTGMNVYEAMPTGSPPVAIGGTTYSPNTSRNITHALSVTPDVVLVNYPTNAYQFLTVHEVMSDLRMIRKTANDAGKACFITTTQPRFDAPFDITVRNRLMEIRDSILLQFGYFAIDFWSTVAKPDGTIDPLYDQGDHIHLNYLGHDILFQRVRDKNIFSTALPVRLVSFKAKSSNNDVAIKWTVANDVDNASYAIQRSQDGAHFDTENEVRGKTNSSIYSYNYLDKDVPSALLYYRLRVSEDGEISYSPTVKILCGQESVFISSVVNKPSEIKLLVESKSRQNIQVIIRNVLGERVSMSTKQIEMGSNQVVVPHSSFSSGVYTVQVFKDAIRLDSRAFLIK